MKNKKLLLSLILVSSSNLIAQPWQTMIGNEINSFGYLGTTNAQPIRIKTNGTHRALFTTGNALSTITGDSGDGLRIVNPVNGTAGELDLFTSANSGQNETHIVWGAVGKYQVKIHD